MQLNKTPSVHVVLYIDCSVKMILSMFLPIVKIVVSSANMNKSPLVITSGRSLTKIENNLGPNIEFWGTPYVMVLDPD